MMKHPAGVLLLLLGSGCPMGTPPPPPPPNPPQVFLTVDEPNVIGKAVAGRVNVSGCKTVAQVQLLQGDSFLADVNFTTSPTVFSLPPGTFSVFYGRLGIAAPLTLKAKVICDDGRSNTSVPVGVKFFPVADRLAGPGGAQLVPDQFVAEGGLGGSANTFLGCVVTPTGTTIARVAKDGDVLQFIAAMPFPCSLATQISELSTTSGTRWIFEPGAGAFAIDNATLQIRKEVREIKASRIGVGKGGSAVIWIDESGRNRILKRDPVVSAANDWQYPTDFFNPARPVGIMNSDPVIDDGAGLAVWFTDWRFDMGTKRAAIVPFKIDLRTGQLLNGIVNGQPAAIFDQQYPMDVTSQPIIPQGVFNADGSFFTMPAISLDAQTTTVISCSTALGLCEGSARRWTSRPLPGILRAVVPFSQGNMLAVVGPYSVWFLSNQLGTVQNLSEAPLVPSGSLVVVGVQPGLGTDFYVLAGPNLGDAPSYAMEIIATDAPSSGELWRLEYGSGESSGNAMWIGIDDSAQVWLRAGTDLVKPLSNSEYRMARGPTVVR